MNRALVKTSLIILGIPLSVSLSWILGGELVHKMSPFVLSSSRMIIGAAILLLLSNVATTQRSWTREQRFTWWRNQLILAITGRALYYYLSSAALLSISAVDALLVTSLMPVFALFIERIIGNRFKSYLLPLTGVLASAFALAAVFSSRGNAAAVSFNIGFLEILGAVLFFALHLSLYSRMTKDPSPVNPLMVQFAIGAALLLPADIRGYLAFSTFAPFDWAQFAVYSVICNLLPFILVHYALKLTSPLTVSSASIASPLFGIGIARMVAHSSVSPSFVVFTLCSVALTWSLVRLNMREKEAESKARLLANGPLDS